MEQQQQQRCSSGHHHQQQMLIDKVDRLVLPDVLLPIHYNLHVEPDLEAFTFKGSVEITLRLNSKDIISTILLHSADLVIHKAEVRRTNSTTKQKLFCQATSIRYNKENETALLVLDQPIVVVQSNNEKDQQVILSMEYSGVINDKMSGFYRSKYTVNGKECWMASTQFEATYFRLCVPGWDEPALKATFDVTITVQGDLMALSNQPLIEGYPKVQKDKDGVTTANTTYRFETTPLMSSYLLAFAIGEFDHIETTTKEGVLVRVYQVIGKDKDENGIFGLDVASRALSFFSSYFEIPYPLKKCDLLAVPEFAFYAMENWGLTTYAEEYVLTSKHSTLYNKQRLAYLICHELAHQWFGNLVTMDWWSQLWLNEGFATFMGSACTNALFPEWSYWLDFSYTYRQGAFDFDSLIATHPIECVARDSSQIAEIFDSISYDKSACVIQMLEARYGDAFRQGVNHYLSQHAYKNTTSDDLWNSISLKANDNVKDFIQSFIIHPGYPTISLTKDNSQNHRYTIEQSKFKFKKDEKEDENDSSVLWNCNIKINNHKDVYLKEKKQLVDLVPAAGKDGSGRWFKLNFGETGYFTICYEKDVLETLIERVRSKELPPVDRLGLLSDSIALCKAGKLDVTLLMQLFESYKTETEYSIWFLLVGSLSNLLSVNYKQPYYSKLVSFVVSILEPTYTRLGFHPTTSDESIGNILIRQRVNTLLGQLSYQPVVLESQKYWDQIKSNTTNHIDNNIKPVILSTIVANGNMETLDIVLENLKQSKDTSETLVYLSAIGSTPLAEGIIKILDLAYSPAIRDTNIMNVYQGIGSQHGEVVWDYFTKHFNQIDSIFNQQINYYIIVQKSIPILSTQLDTYKTFLLDTHSIPIVNRQIHQSLEIVEYNNIWLSNIKDKLNQYLNK
ncbi:hypothetical protein DFA_00878 [Cavenderia fasciculata]|uniref:Aminopeptidase n=1 Tax=Cavenderia fasciculata TaxID=261658 RepID=F4PUD7_CACFS|nr:uncharacterized protein DFA_00878 [Cavenderia fasciculata]EGG21009.1 hypothetical protein DFA_00878 [Cavenderia fasciculata]|eukprot:XP_004358859.1 hypothetical protein DFA_00878 [Cavenderia fasciculata]